MAGLVAAVDVGTGSARAGLFDATGRLLGRAEHPIAMHRPAEGRFEQDSTDIRAAVAEALRAARAEAGASPEAVAGLAFDATCSLVLADTSGAPLPVSPGGGPWDTLAWLDHRAVAEAAEISATDHPGLRALGLPLSPELQLPKLLWLKRHAPATWARLGTAADLSDHLAATATGRPARSRCTLVCKWGWQPGGLAPDLLAACDLADLPALPAPQPIGTPLGPLTPAAAEAFGLTPACIVATGLIDAHAGALGLLGGDPDPSTAALIAGTSNCIMAFADRPTPVPGTWGPFHDVALPDLWMIEGGQSAAGGLLDHICRLWQPYAANSTPDHAAILARIAGMIAAHGPDIAPDLHVLPDFHGSRSPDPDATARGTLTGLALDTSFDGLCRLYWRTATGLALGLARILDHMAGHGRPIARLALGGGHARSPLLAALYADATGREIALSAAPDAVLLGTAMAAATGAGLHPSLEAAARAMHQPRRLLAPDPAAAPRMARDAAILDLMRRHRAEIRALSLP